MILLKRCVSTKNAIISVFPELKQWHNPRGFPLRGGVIICSYIPRNAMANSSDINTNGLHLQEEYKIMSMTF